MNDRPGRTASLVPLAGVAATALLAACGGEGPLDSRGDVTWTTTDTLVTTASGIVGDIADMQVGPDGVLHVVDPMRHLVHRIGPEGGQMAPLGGEGEGPGELREPAAVAVAGDSVLVADHENGRVQVLGEDGAYRDSWPLPARANAAFRDLARDGRYGSGTLGSDGALVAVHDRQGELVNRFGEPAMELPKMIDLRELRRRSAEGEVPDLFRNTAGVHLGPGGFVWLNLTADGLVRKYRPDGTLVFEQRIGDPERSEIFEAFVRKNAEGDRPHALNYVADFAVVGDELWMLLNREADRTVRLVAVGTDGNGVRRIRVPTVRGARAFAVDRGRERLYLGVPSEARVVAVVMEGEAAR